MGSIDKEWFRVTCSTCSVGETGSSTDKGSGWGGSSWNELTKFQKFDVSSEHSYEKGVNITAATCKQCGAPATIESRHGFGQPEGW